MNRPFTHIVSRLLLLPVLAFAGVSSHAQHPNADIYGKWKIKALIGGGIGTLSDHQARQLIGKTFVISAERFEFNGQACAYPRYQRNKENPKKYFDREWRTDVSGIPFPNPVTIIETGCDPLYPIRKDHLMIAERGGFFEAVRIAKAPGTHTSPRRK